MPDRPNILVIFTDQMRADVIGALGNPVIRTPHLDRLVRDGLVEREPHPGDGRAAMLVLTASGRELVERATDALNTEVFADPGLSDDDTTELVAIIARLRKGAGDFADPRPLPEPL